MSFQGTHPDLNGEMPIQKEETETRDYEAQVSTSSAQSNKKLRRAPETVAIPFAGQIGANQAYSLDRNADSNAALLEKDPDAAPGLSLRDIFNLRGFRQIGLWKAAAIEGIGTMILVFITVWANLRPTVPAAPPTARYGFFDNAAFIGPTVGGIVNFLILTIMIFSFGPVSGAHFNPTITIATVFARLCTFPRAVLYVAFQMLGSTFAGLLVRAGQGNRDFQTGGCWMFTDVVPAREVVAVEFMATTGLLFFAFGVGLDPRQRAVIPASLSPFLVGLALGTLSWSTAFTRVGYGGASMNPARCFGCFVGSHFPSWYWVDWIGDICACILHGIVYNIVPPGPGYV